MKPEIITPTPPSPIRGGGFQYKNMMKLGLFFILFCLMAATVAADVIVLKDNRIIKGDVVAEDEQSLTIETGGKPETITKEIISQRMTDAGFEEFIRQQIKLLGDNDWNIREQSTAALKRFGGLARAQLEAALHDPDAEIAYRIEGILGEIGLYHRSLESLWESIRNEVKSEPAENWEYYLPRAKQFIREGNLGEAEKAYLKAIVLSKRLPSVSAQESSEVCFEAGDLYFERSNWAAAIECYLEGLSRDCWHGDVNYRLGRCYEQTGDIWSALSRYRISLKLQPDDDYAEDAQAKVEQLTGQLPPQPPEEAVSLKAAKAVILPLNIKTARPLRLIKLACGEVEKNLGISLMVKEPLNLIDAAFKLSDSRYDKRYDADKIRDRLAEIYTASYAKEAVTLIGMTYYDISTKNSNYLFGWSGANAAVVSYGQMREWLNDENNEKNVIKRLAAQLATSIGRTLMMKSCSDPTCAMAYVGSLEELDKRTTVLCADCATLFKGYVLGHLKEYDKAFRFIYRYLERRPNDASAHFEAGRLHWRLNDWDKAIKSYETVLKIEPGNNAAKDALARAKQQKAQKTK